MTSDAICSLLGATSSLNVQLQLQGGCPDGGWTYSEQYVTIPANKRVTSVDAYVMLRNLPGRVAIDDPRIVECPTTGGLCGVPQPTTSHPIKVLIPLYIYPGSTGIAAWNRVADAATAYPNVPVIAIVNSNNGPSSCGNSDYVSGVQVLKNGGVSMIGYVYTGYGERALEDIFADIDSWKACPYGSDLAGVFLDETSDDPWRVPYYKRIYRKVCL
tara:strand:+ start:3094 stop:3738 length:645 start_codon:yes stop_codon:yes gene_type:complete